MTSSHPLPAPCQWFSRLASALDRRSAPRLALLFLGAVLARGRRTVTSWIRAAGLSDQFRPCYTAVAAAGKQADRIAARLVLRGGQAAGGRGRAADARPGRHPDRSGTGRTSRGPASTTTRPPARPARPFVYGHVWVVLGLLATHPAWGVDRPAAAGPAVRPQEGPAAASTRSTGRRSGPSWSWPSSCCGGPSRGWGSWASRSGWWPTGRTPRRPFLKPAKALGVTVVSRLRKDAALWTRARAAAAGPARAGRGSTASGGSTWPSGPASGAGGRPGRSTCTGSRRSKRYKTFLATWRPAGGVIRVVLVDEPTGWVAFFCTDPSATVADILAARRRPLQPGDHVPRLQGGRRGGPAAGAVRVGERRGVPRLPVDVHDDRGVGLGPAGGRVGGPLGLAVGRRRCAARATRTSGGRGGVSCWARKFVRFYAPGSPRRKFRPPPNGCSAWLHEHEGSLGKYTIISDRLRIVEGEFQLQLQHKRLPSCSSGVR